MYDYYDRQEIDSVVAKILSKLELIKNDLTHDENDHKNVYVEFTAGSGGLEAQDWANILFGIYLRFIELQGLKAEIQNIEYDDYDGIKTALIFVTGKSPYKILKNEHGVHRLIRKSPFGKNDLTHTSFAGITITPEVPEFEFKLNMSDIRKDVYKASGAGGQHIQKTESAVRLTHIPTGISVACQTSRSQHMNYDSALKNLEARLFQREQQIENNKQIVVAENISFGKQIRTYMFDKSFVKDHRTGKEHHRLDDVLAGKLHLLS